MTSDSKPLRMNQGDPTEGRVYFLPHFVARNLGFFEMEGVKIDFIWAEPGDHLAKSGQIPAVLNGDADFTVGGPMVTMRMQADKSANLVNFCALVQKNPWYLAARQAPEDFQWSDLAGKTILDIGSITTASLSLRWVLAQNGLDQQVTIIETGADESAAFERHLAGEGDYVFHSLHALGPYLADKRLTVVTDLAEATGSVPWSAYITLPETLQNREADMKAFLRAIARAQSWIAAATPEQIVDVVKADYPGYPRDGLILAVSLYKAIDVWAPTPRISREDFERFRGLLMDVGWFSQPVPYEDQVATRLMAAAAA